MKTLRIMLTMLALLMVLAACMRSDDEISAVSDAPRVESEAQNESTITPPEEDGPATQEYENDEPEPALPRLTAAIFPFEFEAEDLFGNVVTHESYGERELFLLYLWTTWCGACIAAMPGMAELAAEFYDRMGFVSLLGDFESGKEAAIRLTENANAPFFTVDVMLDDFAPLIPFIASPFVPTSALIDAQGNQIGDMIVGSDIDGLRDKINAALGD